MLLWKQLPPKPASVPSQMPAIGGTPLAAARVWCLPSGKLRQPGHDVHASEMGKPLSRYRYNDLEQVEAWLKDLLGGLVDLRLGQHLEMKRAV